MNETDPQDNFEKDKVIQQLKEQLHEANSHSQQTPAGSDPKATPEE